LLHPSFSAHKVHSECTIGFDLGDKPRVSTELERAKSHDESGARPHYDADRCNEKNVVK